MSSLKKNKRERKTWPAEGSKKDKSSETVVKYSVLELTIVLVPLIFVYSKTTWHFIPQHRYKRQSVSPITVTLIMWSVKKQINKTSFRKERILDQFLYILSVVLRPSVNNVFKPSLWNACGTIVLGTSSGSGRAGRSPTTDIQFPARWPLSRRTLPHRSAKSKSRGLDGIFCYRLSKFLPQIEWAKVTFRMQKAGVKIEAICAR